MTYQCEHPSGCERGFYSWSPDHDNTKLCIVHYNEYLKNRDTIKLQKILAMIPKDTLKQVVKEALANAN